MHTLPEYDRQRIDLISCGISALALFLILKYHLITALFSGLLVFELVHVLAPRLRLRNLEQSRAKLMAVALLASLIVALLTAAVFALVAFFRSGSGGLPVLAQMMADIIEGSRSMLPASVVENLPDDVTEIKLLMAEWLRQHSRDVQMAGGAVLHTLVHMLMGMAIGAFLSLREARDPSLDGPPLAMALTERALRFGTSFRRVVFAQVRIAGLNAFLTWLYLGVALPLMGIPLPYTKTLVLVTFLAGLLPVIGNLISNTVIVVVSLKVSFQIAVASLVFLMVIHKLEYFVNAKIIGSRINAKVWELLLAMLFMEALFGVRGLVAAPVYYAYLKDELERRGLV